MLGHVGICQNRVPGIVLRLSGDYRASFLMSLCMQANDVNLVGLWSLLEKIV